jgi:glutaredoxin
MKVKIYGTDFCHFCKESVKLCKEKNISYEKIDLIEQPELRTKISQENDNFPTIPMIFVDDIFIGGYTSLQKTLS